MKSKNIFQLTALMILSAIAINACKKHDDHDHDHDHDHELITTVNALVFDTLGNPVDTFIWTQPLGPGTPITFDSINLKPLTRYKVKLELWDKSKEPYTNFTSVIKERANEHLLVYTSNAGLEFSINDSDYRVPPLPLGLDFDIKTTNQNSGTLNIKLYHFTDNHKEHGSSAGTTDIDITYPLSVKN